MSELYRIAYVVDVKIVWPGMNNPGEDPEGVDWVASHPPLEQSTKRI